MKPFDEFLLDNVPNFRDKLAEQVADALESGEHVCCIDLSENYGLADRGDCSPGEVMIFETERYDPAADDEAGWPSYWNPQRKAWYVLITPHANDLVRELFRTAGIEFVE